MRSYLDEDGEKDLDRLFAGLAAIQLASIAMVGEGGQLVRPSQNLRGAGGAVGLRHFRGIGCKGKKV